MTGKAPVFLLLAALGAACAGTGTPTGTTRVDERFARGGGQFNVGTTIDVAVDAREQGGELALCGAWAPRNVTAMSALYVDDAVSSGVVQLGGRNVLQNPGQFRRLPEDAPLEGAEATCFATGQPWQPSHAAAPIEVRFVRQGYEREDEGTGGYSVVFRERATVQPPARSGG